MGAKDDVRDIARSTRRTMIQLAIVVLAAAVVLGAGFAYAWCVNRERTDSDTKVRVEGQP